MAINKNKVMEAAQKYVEKGQTDKAIKEYLKVVQEDPKDVRVWLKIGDLYAKKGAKQEATETYLKVAQFYSEQGFYLKAVAVYKQILKIDPRLVEVNMKLAELYRQLGLLSDAMQQYELVAAFYHREGRSREALATIKELAELDPENVATRIKLAELYSKESMPKEAVVEFTKAADYLRSHNRMDDFIKVAERLVWHQPDNHAINRELATLYLKRNDPRRALQKLQSCFKADPRDVETLTLLAEAFEALDQTAKTVSVWKELARIHNENGHRDKAHDVYRQILKLVPDDADARAALGGAAAPPMAAGGRRPAAGTGGHATIQPPLPPPPPPYAVTTPVPGPSTPPPIPPAASGAYPRVATPITVGNTGPGSAAQGSPTPQPVGPAGPRSSPPRRPTGSVPLVSPMSFDDPLAAPPPVAVADPEVESDDSPILAFKRSGREQTTRREELEPDVVEEIGSDVIVVEPGEAHADEIAKVLTETDVYVKYGLHQKALEHLKRVFELDPENVEAREKLKETYLAMGRQADALEELLRLAERVAPQHPQQAAAYLEELLAIDPEDDRAKALQQRYRLDVSTPAPATISSRSYDELGPEIMSEESAPEFEFDDLSGPSAPQLSTPPTHPKATLPEVDFAADDLIEGEDSIRPRQGFGGVLQPQTGEGLPAPEFDAEFDDFAAAEGATDAEQGVLRTDPESQKMEASSVGAPGAGHGGTTTLEDDLDEADFFIGQNLFEEAKQILHDLLGRYPNHPLVLAKLQDVEALHGSAPPDAMPSLETPIPFGSKPPQIGSKPPQGASKSPQPATRTERAPSPGASAPVTVTPPPQKRPAVIAKALGDEDADTHWDLGLAYKEMGLYDEAVREFTLILNTPGRAVQCHLMIGRCQAERGKFSEAIAEFKKGLYIEGITELQSLDLYFEIGASYEALGDSREALYYYEKVAKRDPRFREVEKRVESLKARGAASSHRTNGHDDDDGDLLEDAPSGDVTTQ